MIRNRHEQGQSLVLFSIALLGLVAVAALIVDAGSLYVNRRIAQTAADAAALAGAHEKCVELGNPTSPTASDIAAIQSVVNNYAAQNHAAAGPITIDANGSVVTQTTVSAPSFFASVLGRPTNVSRAGSRAGCFPPAGVTGARPIAWACGPLNGQPVGQCNINTIPWSDFQAIRGALGDPFFGNPAATNHGVLDARTVGGALSTYWDGSGTRMYYVVMAKGGTGTLPPNVSSQNSGWFELQFSCTNPTCLGNELQNGVSQLLIVPQWFASVPGAKASVLDSPPALFQPIKVPIVNAYCPKGSPIPSCTGYQAGDLIAAGASTDYYRVAGFAVFVPTCIAKTTNCPAQVDAGLGKDTIEGYMVTGYGGSQIGTGPNLGLYVISLTQ